MDAYVEMIKALKVSAFALVAMLGILGAELSQAIAEGFLLPRETQMHAMVNQTRSSRGLSGLDEHDALKTIARRQAQAMAAAGYIYHTPDLAQQARQHSISYSMLGENVGVGPDVEAVQRAFLASPGHLENIVDPQFNALGVGAISGGSGALYFSQNFGALRAAAPAAPAAPAVAAPAPTPAGATSPPVQAGATATSESPPPNGESGRTTTAATPEPVNPLVASIPGTLDRFPAMAGVTSGARGIYSSRPSSPVAGLEPSQSRPVTLPMTLAAMIGRFAQTLAFWR